MKKITLILLVLTACLKSFSQHPIGTDSLSLQTLANSNTLVKSKGAIGSDSGFVNTVYPDTTSANYGKIKNYPGAQIRVGDTIWLRNFNATKWLNLTAGISAIDLTWQNTLDNSSTLTHNNFSDMQGSDFFFDNGGIFTFNVNDFAIPYLATPAGNQDIFVGADEFGNLYKKQLVLPVDSGGFSGTQDWQSTIDQGNRMRHPNTVHFVNYDWYTDSLGNTSEFSGETATFDNQVGAYTEKHQDSANAYLYAQDTTGIQGTEMRVHPDSAHMQAWDADGNNTYFTLFRKGTTRTFANIADTLDAPVINFPQFHNADTTSNQINIDQTGNLYWTNKSGVQVTTTNSLDIYHENVEWATSTNVGNINPASTNFPCSGTLSIEGTTVGDGDYIKFNAPVVPDYSQYNYLVFKISSKGTWASGRRLRLRWLNGSTLLGVGVNFTDGSYGFKSNITDSCQLIYIPLGAFGDITGADNLRIVGSITSSGTVGYFIDDIVLQYSAISPIIGGALTWDQTMRNSPDISKDYFSHFNSSTWTMDSIMQLRIHVQDWVDIIGDKDAGREYMLKMHVNDAGNSLMAFANATVANGRFAPLIAGYQSPFPSPTTGADLSFRGLVHPDNDIAGDPVFQFVGAGTHDDSDPNAPPLYMVNTKDIFAIGDSDLQYFMVKASGQLQFPMYVGGAFTGTVAYGLGLDALGNVIVTDTSSGGGGGSADRFGLEDVTTPSARTVDMQENSFILNNSPYNGFYDNTADAIFEVYFPTSGSAIYLTSAENNISAAGNNNISGTTNNLTGNANTIRSTGANPNIFLDAIGSGSGAGKISIRAADNTPTTGAVLHTDFITNWDNTNRDFQFPKASGTFVLSINGNLADSTGNVTISTGISSETDAIALAKTITENDGYGLIETQTATQALSTNPSWTRRIDTFAIETRDRGLKIVDSIRSVISEGTVTGANPTASVGLSVVNGSAVTFMRSDAAPALSQSIAPTWTGTHLFNNTVDLHSNVFMTGLSAGSSTDSFVTIKANQVFKQPFSNVSPFIRGTVTGMANTTNVIWPRTQADSMFFGPAYGSGNITPQSMYNWNGSASFNTTVRVNGVFTAFSTSTLSGAVTFQNKATGSVGSSASIATGYDFSLTANNTTPGSNAIGLSGSIITQSTGIYTNKNLIGVEGSTAAFDAGTATLTGTFITGVYGYGFSQYNNSTPATIYGVSAKNEDKYGGGVGYNFYARGAIHDGATKYAEVGSVKIDSIATSEVTTGVPFAVNQLGSNMTAFWAANTFIGDAALTSPVASAKLEVFSTTKGFLPPRMTTTQRDAISSPAEGLIIYNTSLHKHEGFDGTTWNDFY